MLENIKTDVWKLADKDVNLASVVNLIDQKPNWMKKKKIKLLLKDEAEKIAENYKIKLK